MAKEKSTQWLTASWHGAFPAEDAKVVVQFMWDTWELLRTKHPKGINYKTKNEPKITTFYCGVLQSFAQAKGIYGKFDYETPHGKPNLETGEMEDRIRTDIRYLFPIQDSDNSHEIIFEFKILKNTNDSRKAYYQKNGMHRFISGDYSKKWDFAYMVGILTNDGRTAVKELKKVLQRNDLANGTEPVRNSV